MTPAPPAPQWIPDLCRAPAVVRVLLVSQMLAVLLVVARNRPLPQLVDDLLLVSLFIHWVSLSSCALLCAIRRYLNRLTLFESVCLALGSLWLLTLVLAEVAWQLQLWMQPQRPADAALHWLFLGRIQIIALLAWVVLLRYFYLQQQSERQQQAMLEGRLQALQDRMRPHFLFNSLNSLLALIPTKPDAAEDLVDNLSSLLRAALEHSDGQHTLAEEITLTRAYLDIEALRLESRLEVAWDLDPDLEGQMVPVFSLQPLAENAVLHGIEPRIEGGRVGIRSLRLDAQRWMLEVRNPSAQDHRSPVRHGIGEDNLRHRLTMLHGSLGRLQTGVEGQDYVARMVLPWVPSAPDAKP
jgi:two-component system sensor histidine kinase AlgZ